MARKRKEEKRTRVNWIIIGFLFFVAVFMILIILDTNRIQDGFYPIRIYRKKELETNIGRPGVAIVKKGKTKYFTVAHWFGPGTNDQFFLVFQRRKYWIEKIQYLGNDRVEIFPGKGGVVIKSCCDIDLSRAQYQCRGTSFTQLETPLQLTSLIDNKSYPFTHKTVLEHLENKAEKIEGLTIFSNIATIFFEGESGTPFMDKDDNIYLHSAAFNAMTQERKIVGVQVVVKIDY